MSSIDIRELPRSEMVAAAAVLGRGMRDNPMHVAAFGTDPDRREATLTRMFKALLRSYPSKGAVLGGFSAGKLIGVCGMIEPGRCRLTGKEKLDVLAVILGSSGLTGAGRALKCVKAWLRQDPKKPHWHLGPVGVERHLQGKGVGSALLRVFSERVDEAGSIAYLETDKQVNVTFYERFGFRVIAEASALDVPGWFMVRDPGSGKGSGQQPQRLAELAMSGNEGSDGGERSARER